MQWSWSELSIFTACVIETVCQLLRRGHPFPQKVHHAFSYSHTSLSKPNDCPRICQWTTVMSTETPSKGREHWVPSASLPLPCRVSSASQTKGELSSAVSFPSPSLQLPRSPLQPTMGTSAEWLPVLLWSMWATWLLRNGPSLWAYPGLPLG